MYAPSETAINVLFSGKNSMLFSFQWKLFGDLYIEYGAPELWSVDFYSCNFTKFVFNMKTDLWCHGICQYVKIASCNGFLLYLLQKSRKKASSDEDDDDDDDDDGYVPPPRASVGGRARKPVKYNFGDDDEDGDDDD